MENTTEIPNVNKLKIITSIRIFKDSFWKAEVPWYTKHLLKACFTLCSLREDTFWSCDVMLTACERKTHTNENIFCPSIFTWKHVLNDCFSHFKLEFLCLFVWLIMAYFMIFFKHNYIIIFAAVGPSDGEERWKIVWRGGEVGLRFKSLLWQGHWGSYTFMRNKRNLIYWYNWRIWRQKKKKRKKIIFRNSGCDSKLK